MKKYEKLKVIICMGEHTQMIGHTTGCKVISLVSHPKLKYFMKDIDSDDLLIDVNKDKKMRKKSLGILLRKKLKNNYVINSNNNSYYDE